MKKLNTQCVVLEDVLCCQFLAGGTGKSVVYWEFQSRSKVALAMATAVGQLVLVPTPRVLVK